MSIPNNISVSIFGVPREENSAPKKFDAATKNIIKTVISSDLSHFLEYVELKETDFWKIADKFRDPRVWRIKNKQWYKDNIWGDESAYGDVYLNKNEQENFNIRKKI